VLTKDNTLLYKGNRTTKRRCDTMRPKLSGTEWLIMNVLWERTPLSASEVHEGLAATQDCTPKTVRTLLDRLLAKKAVVRERIHGVWVYRAAVGRDACLAGESHSFLKRFFHADPVPLVAHLLRTGNLTDAQMAELRALLDAEAPEREGGCGDD
jgi:BlaI family penicillinase repressor